LGSLHRVSVRPNDERYLVPPEEIDCLDWRDSIVQSWRARRSRQLPREASIHVARPPVLMLRPALDRMRPGKRGT
jgi:hypothetical protein